MFMLSNKLLLLLIIIIVFQDGQHVTHDVAGLKNQAQTCAHKRVIVNGRRGPTSLQLTPDIISKFDSRPVTGGLMLQGWSIIAVRQVGRFRASFYYRYKGSMRGQETRIKRRRRRRRNRRKQGVDSAAEVEPPPAIEP
eukprot:2041710-Amphidinium_carterae.1